MTLRQWIIRAHEICCSSESTGEGVSPALFLLFLLPAQFSKALPFLFEAPLALVLGLLNPPLLRLDPLALFLCSLLLSNTSLARYPLFLFYSSLLRFGR